ncbi:MAG: hypothetical protein R8J85_09470 [Mariprofundales bacterium]
MSDGVGMAGKGVRPFSIKQLILLFIISTLLFCIGRWDGNGWLQQQLLPRLAAYGVHATVVARDGSRIRLQQVVVDGVDIAGAPLQWDEVVVAPKWSSLLKLSPAVRLSMRWQQAVIDAEVSAVDEVHLAMRQLNVSFPLAMVAPLLPPMPVTLAGGVVCQGAVVLNRVATQFAQPDLRCDWQQATVTMGGKPMLLGSYQLVVNSAAEDWHWALSGGDVAKVEGAGAVHPVANMAMAAWSIDGALTVHAGQGAVGAMVGAMLGTQPHTIGGRLAAPEFH